MSLSLKPKLEAASLECVPNHDRIQTSEAYNAEKFASGNQDFAFKLYKTLLEENPEENVFISPMSIAIVLAMLHNGAHGQTQTDIAAALELDGFTSEEINQGYLALQTSLEALDPEVNLAIANSLWLHQDFSIKTQFCRDSATYYRAIATELDFSAPQSPGTINQWAHDNTQGKIQQIVQKLKPSQALILANALYFKGDWQSQFDQTKTRDQAFFLNEEQSKQHPLMWQRGQYHYFENESIQAVNLPYGNGRMSLYIFLPRSGFDLQTIQQGLDAKTWEIWLRKFQKRAGTIEIPRFKLESTYQLKKSLASLGLQSIFNGQHTDFSALTDRKVAVAQVTQKTFIEVNEEGTEAAAVTSVSLIPVMSNPNREMPFSMKVDRPFFIALNDNETNTLLFLGAIRNP